MPSKLHQPFDLLIYLHSQNRSPVHAARSITSRKERLKPYFGRYKTFRSLDLSIVSCLVATKLLHPDNKAGLKGWWRSRIDLSTLSLLLNHLYSICLGWQKKKEKAHSKAFFQRICCSPISRERGPGPRPASLDCYCWHADWVYMSPCVE